MRLVWDINAWEDYVWWQAQDRKVTDQHRLVYKIIDDAEVRIAACRYHYGR